jgi:biopolymer transport protein ExbB/TolQ
MELWQTIISICAGIITIVTVLEKLGINKRVSKIDNEFNSLKKLPDQVKGIQDELKNLGNLQLDQNNALLAMLRNTLYQSFKDNRDIAAWTDDECSVQTKIHNAYKTLQGNGEEEIWWERKKTWKIVSNEEYEKLYKANQSKIHCL